MPKEDYSQKYISNNPFLLHYCAALKQSNPLSVIQWVIDRVIIQWYFSLKIYGN